VYREECSERIRLADEYSRTVTDFNVLLEALKTGSPGREQADWSGIEMARLRSQHAWNLLEAHIAAHECLELAWSAPPATGSGASSDPLKAAAMAALDVIVVTDDQRRFVDLNEAAEAAFQLPRSEIIGRKLDDFFLAVRGLTMPEAWAGFIAEGVQSGICELIAPGVPRRFEYRAKANFAPGLHLAVLREIRLDESGNDKLTSS
jgi:PAS domain-containing protein